MSNNRGMTGDEIEGMLAMLEDIPSDYEEDTDNEDDSDDESQWVPKDPLSKALGEETEECEQ